MYNKMNLPIREILFLLISFTLISCANITTPSPTPKTKNSVLQVGCRPGQPPLADFSTIENKCTGLFAEVFTIAADRAKLAYNMSWFNSDISTALTTGDYDVIIAFHTINPSRLKQYDFSSPLMSSDNIIVLNPSYRHTDGSLDSAIIRDPVMYLFSIVTVSIGIVAIVFLVFESMEPQSAIHELPHHRRILWAMEM
eukprot:PhF_6_TR37130/c0_g3_i6/m.54607